MLRLLVLALGTFAIGTDSYVIAGVLPRVAWTLHVGVAAAGQLVTAYAAVYALLTPVLAATTSRWPRRRVLATGLGVFVAGNVVTAFASSLGLALVGRAIAGLGAASFTPVAGATAVALVAPERRGRALAVVVAGLSGATALGAPLGTWIGNTADWCATLWLVAGLGALAAAGVVLVLPAMPATTSPRLRERLAPLLDPRVTATLATTLLVMFGIFLVYTYLSLVLDRATGRSGVRLAALLSIWGVAATTGNLLSGALVDRLGSRWIVGGAIIVAALDFALMPWTSARFATASLALVVWGLAGWGMVVAQQHRLVGLSTLGAPLLLALNASAIYLAVSASSATGALVLARMDPHRLPLLGAVLILAALPVSELAHRLIQDSASPVPPVPAPTVLGTAPPTR